MSFIKMQRSPDVDKLLRHPLEFVLLSQIAKRARRSDDDTNIDNLKPGQALIGDYQSLGMSRQQYRRCLTNLQTWRQVTIQPTNKGTIATIINTSVFDINIILNQPTNTHPTNQPTNPEPTTNKNSKKIKKVKKKDIAPKKGAKWQESTPMDLKQFIEWCRKSKDSHVQIIGEWADEMNQSFKFNGYETYGEWYRLFFKQNLKAARDLSVSWKQENGRTRMGEAIALLVSESKNGHWKTGNLSTLIKYMSKV